MGARPTWSNVRARLSAGWGRARAWTAARIGTVQNRFGPTYQRARRRLAEHPVRIALALSFTATMIAATTLRAGEWDLAATSCTRALAEAQMYEVVQEQASKDRLTERARAQAEHTARVNEAWSLREAGAMTGAQLQFAIARTIRPVLEFTDPTSPDFAASDESPAEVTRSDFRETVLRALCPHVTVAGGARTAEGFVDELGRDVEQIERLSASDSKLALCFAVALLMLTLSDLARGRIAGAFFVASFILIAVTVNEGIGRLDRSLALYFGVALVAYAVIVSLSIALMMRTDRTIGPPGPFEDIAKATPSRLVLLVTMAALFNALGGTFYSGSNGNSNLRSAEAQQLQFAMLRTGSTYRTRAYATINGLWALREAELGRKSGLPGASSRWNAIAQLFASEKPSENPADALAPPLSQLVVGEYGPYADAKYPSRFFIDRTVTTPARLFAQRDAFDEQSTVWDRRTSRFLAILAALALAAYLGGEALRMRHSRASYLLGIFAGCSLTAGLVFGIWTVAEPVPQLDTVVDMPGICVTHNENTRLPRYIAAAVCFAAGSYEAKAHHDENAVKMYEAAHTVRHGFTVARFSAALKRVAHPQTGSLREAIEDEHKAIRDLDALKLEISEPIANNVGYHEMILALSTADPNFARDALQDTERAARARPDVPALWFHYGLALLAKPSEAWHARVAFERGARTMSHRTGIGEDARRLIGADAISDLELFRARCRNVISDETGAACDQRSLLIDHLVSKIVNATWPRDAPRSRLHLRDGLEVAAGPGGIGWHVPSRGNESPNTARLVLLVSQFQDAEKFWRVLPDLSYQIDPRTLTRRNGRIGGYRSMILRSSSSECLQGDQHYRLDFFIDGNPVVSRTVDPIVLNRFQRVVFREAGAAMCVPATWSRRPDAAGMLAGAVSAPDGTGGAALYGFFDGRSRKAAAVDGSTMSSALNHAERSFAGIRLHGVSFRQSPARCETAHDPYAPSPHVQLAGQGLKVFVKTWRAPDGLDVVGIVWERPGMTDHIGCAVLSSMTSIDRDVSAVRPKAVKRGAPRN